MMMIRGGEGGEGLKGYIPAVEDIWFMPTISL